MLRVLWKENKVEQSIAAGEEPHSHPWVYKSDWNWWKITLFQWVYFFNKSRNNEYYCIWQQSEITGIESLRCKHNLLSTPRLHHSKWKALRFWVIPRLYVRFTPFTLPQNLQLKQPAMHKRFATISNNEWQSRMRENKCN